MLLRLSLTPSAMVISHCTRLPYHEKLSVWLDAWLWHPSRLFDPQTLQIISHFCHSHFIVLLIEPYSFCQVLVFPFVLLLVSSIVAQNLLLRQKIFNILSSSSSGESVITL